MMRVDVLASDNNMMGFCTHHQQWEGWCSEGLVTISKAAFATAFCAAMVLGIDDTDDETMSDDELTSMARTVRQLFYAEHWRNAPAELGATITPADKVGTDDNETTDL